MNRTVENWHLGVFLFEGLLNTIVQLIAVSQPRSSAGLSATSAQLRASSNAAYTMTECGANTAPTMCGLGGCFSPA